jgi:hypothetical protein
MREWSGSAKESDAIQLLKIREGDIAHGLPVNPMLNRIRFDEAVEDLKTEYAVNGRRSADELERRIRLHLLPHFSGRRLATITTADINTFILKRRADVIVSRAGEDRTERKVSNGENNRKLTTLKRILNLARPNGKLTHVPHIPMLKSGMCGRASWSATRSPGSSPTCRGMSTSRAHVVRLDSHTTKNDEGRTFPFTDALEQVLEAQKAEHERLKAEGLICPWVFNRTNKKMMGKRITTFVKAFRAACTKAGCPVASHTTCGGPPCATWCAPGFPSAWPRR